MGKRVNMTKNKTALFNLHQTNKAKFVEFAGYEMPIQYEKGIVEEHKITRSAAGIFDVSHMGQLFIYGDNKLTEDLEKIFPLNLRELKVFKSKYSFLMNDQAGIHDDLIITKLDEGYLIILNAACKDNDFKIIQELLGKNLLNKNILNIIKNPDFHSLNFDKTNKKYDHSFVHELDDYLNRQLRIKLKKISKNKILLTITDLTLQRNLEKINFFKPLEKKTKMLENLRSIFYKMELSDKETRILSSVFASLAKKG